MVHYITFFFFSALIFNFFLLFYLIFRNIPIGVLYDLFGEESIPWSLDVHYQNFPETKMQRCHNEETIKFYFMNNLKEVKKNIKNQKKRQYLKYF